MTTQGISIPERRSLFLEVIDHEESVETKRDSTGKTVPIEGSGTAFLHLRAPDGTIIRAEIPHEELDRVLWFIWPDDFDPPPSTASP